VTVWFADQAWLGGDGLAAGVVLEEATGDGRLARVAAGQDPPAGAVHLAGIVVPGLANVHSHAFHRALRGRAQAGAGDFWRWRDRMYALAAVLDPDDVFELARGTYAEMALAGITAVGEFHYLHHRPDGRPYADANVMGGALIAAAAEAGVRLTVLDTCYLRSGFGGGSRPAGPQVRFSDGDAESWVARVEDLANQVGGGWRLGAAVHSVRALDERSMAAVAGWARRRGSPLHMHLSEQPAENDEALAATGRTPTALAEAAGVLGPGTVAVHATHLTDPDVKALGATGTGVCLCPTTERDLGDGVGPTDRLVAAGARLSLGSDSHAMIDLLEEARLIELHERLAHHHRGTHSPAALLGAATAAGYRALGWSGAGDGRPAPTGLAPGGPADFAVLDPGSVRLAGIDAAEGVAGVVFAATAADVTDVVVGGRTIVRGRSHVTVPDVARDLHRAITSVWART
jgi:formiminoglutamate deiminase